MVLTVAAVAGLLKPLIEAAVPVTFIQEPPQMELLELGIDSGTTIMMDLVLVLMPIC